MSVIINKQGGYMEKKKIIALGVLCTGILLMGGCGKTAKLSDGSDAVVTFNNDHAISADDLYNKLKTDYALQALVTMTDTYIMETEFPDYVDTSKQYSESYIKSMEDNYGSEDKLLQALQYYTNYSTIDAYKEYVYLNYMETHATTEYAKTLVTDKEISNYYKNTSVGGIEVSQILITPNVKSDATTDEKTQAETDAKNKAQEVIDKLNEAKNNGEDVTAKFSELAKEYSDDDSTKDNGGSLGKINYGKLDSTYDELVKAAYPLKDGEFSTSIITTELGYHG